MSTFPEAVQEQLNSGEEIQRLVTNFKKQSESKKTRKYYEGRLQQLQAMLQEFEEDHNRILQLKDLDRQHDYFANDYFTEVITLAKHYCSVFQSAIDSMDASTSKGTYTEAFKKPSENTKEDVTKHVSPINAMEDMQPASMLGLMRKQRALKTSLGRLLEMDIEDNQPETYYKLKIQSIDRLWTQVEAINYTLWENMDDPGATGYDMDEYLLMETRVQSIVATLAVKSEEVAADTHNYRYGGGSDMQLPKIVIPKFDGSYLKWPQFYDLFVEMIHRKPLDSIQKMWYLKTNLVGEAERLIRHLPLTKENYTTAWEILKDRYHNKRILVSTILQRLLEQPANNSDSASTNSIKVLHDTTRESLLALEALEIPTESWGPLLLHVLLKKLDRLTRVLYEQSLSNPKELQSMDGFLKFLELRFHSLEAVSQRKDKPNNVKACTAATTTTSASVSSPTTLASSASVAATSQPTKPTPGICKFCQQGAHPLYTCVQFLHATVGKRNQHVKDQRLCFNCMRAGHQLKSCTSRNCTKCDRKHHTLLHPDSASAPSTTSADYRTNNQQKEVTTATCTQTQSECNLRSTATASKNMQPGGYVLLGTVRVKVSSGDGQDYKCRAVLDSGSQVNIVTERLVKQLGLSPESATLTIEGIGKEKRQTNNRVKLNIRSSTSDFTTPVEAYILPNIISKQPSLELDITGWPLPSNLQLADSEFHRPDNIDLLLGAEFYPSVITHGRIKLAEHLPILQNTVFGWVVGGKINSETQKNAFCGIYTEEEQVTDLLNRFCELEEFEYEATTLTAAEKQCETHFAQTTRRSQDGRFVVKLPFVEDPSTLGTSMTKATSRFLALERRLSQDPQLKEQYVEFMENYEQLGHMIEIDTDEILTPHYFIPHHCVSKPNNTTTKLRVVFDASAKTTSGRSLNDILHKGPTIQSGLFSILLRFRFPRFAFKVDAKKMFRQIRIDPSDEMLQLIVWRKDPVNTLKCYRLRTVTYGTRPATYLATKCFQQLAKENKVRFPLGAAALERDFYVDDGLTGSDSLTDAIHIQHQLKKILQGGGFELHKWCANHIQLLQGIPEEDQEVNLELADNKNNTVKTLGLIWAPQSDNLRIVTNIDTTRPISKRTVASDLARIFDPLGLLAPVVVTAKIFSQQLTKMKLTLDDAIPEAYQREWSKFRTDLRELNDTTIPRHIFNQEVPTKVQLHCFTDASLEAYGAVIFTRAILQNGTVAIRLLCAKSRVVPPVKPTIPKLELCAALLGAELMAKVKHDLNFEDNQTFFWADSTTVLGWINTRSSLEDIFVAHRVAKIQQLCITEQWRYVNTKHNPADVISRGLEPKELHTCNIWFYGPLFLYGHESTWPPVAQRVHMITGDIETQEQSAESSVAASATTIELTATTISISQDILYNINTRNSFPKLLRIIGYIMRFIKHAKGKTGQGCSSIIQNPNELEDALHVVVRSIQQVDFKQDLEQLKLTNKVRNTSSIVGLSPFLQRGTGIIRVGGRLEASSLAYDAKHPMLLPYNDPIVKLMIQDVHEKNKHCTQKALEAIVKQRFWPIKLGTMARSIVHNCVRCTRARPVLYQQIMGHLPATRVTPARPFLNTGVDFCGPFWVHFKVRGKRPHKAYIAVYCCFATKAVHLELVSDLTTDAFIGSLKRFIARRGHCQNLYCDNATNFVGASNKLMEIANIIHEDSSQIQITKTCSEKGIKFNFIPPRAPHFGGLWEAAVKSAKHLLVRSTETASLTYEELETVVVEIEAILNSRPITPMSSDPNDLKAITPGHFLIGEPLTAPVGANSTPKPMGLLERWKLVSSIKDDFWKQWSTQYLNELQHRRKWKTEKSNVEAGTMVIIKEDNTPPLQWPLGRIVKVYHGDDGIVRVVDVKTSSGVVKRAIHRLAPLFPDDPTTQTEECQGPTNPTTQEPNNLKPPSATEASTSGTSTNNQPSKKRARVSTGSAILSLLLAIVFVLPTSSQGISILPFNTEPGVYFEKIGSVGIITSEWNMVTYFDMQPYWKEHKIIREYLQIFQKLCQGAIQHNSCSRIGFQLEKTARDLERNNELLRPTPQTRRKRGAFNFVGNVAHSLFGVLDSEYAEELAVTINNLRHTDNLIARQIQNQTTFIDSTIAIMKRGQQDTEREFKDIELALNRTTALLKNTQLTEKASQELMELAFQTLTLIMNFQRLQDSLLDTVMDSHHGKINPELLPPEQLKTELLHLQATLPKSIVLPTSTENLKLYSLMTIQGRVTKQYVIFTIKIPLVNAEQFELLHVIPVPWKSEQNFVALKPFAPYLIIDLHREQFYPISADELRRCVSTEKDRFLCRHNYPLFRRGSKKGSCELDLLSHATTSSCEPALADPAPYWIQLHDPNAWIYILDQETSLNIVCGSSLIQRTVSGSGILTLDGGCTLKQPLITIQGHNSFESNSNFSYIPTANISELVQALTTPETPHTSYRHQFRAHEEEISNLKRQLTAFKVNAPFDSPMHHIHHYTMSYVSLVLIVSTAAIITYFVRRHHLGGPTVLPLQAVPVPAPRMEATTLPFTVHET